jgi:hypothetical protein
MEVDSVPPPISKNWLEEVNEFTPVIEPLTVLPADALMPLSLGVVKLNVE